MDIGNVFFQFFKKKKGKIETDIGNVYIKFLRIKKVK
jgi:hypothetical protein